MAGRCLYVKFCENPALDNCPEAASVWGGSTEIVEEDANGSSAPIASYVAIFLVFCGLCAQFY